MMVCLCFSYLSIAIVGRSLPYGSGGIGEGPESKLEATRGGPADSAGDGGAGKYPRVAASAPLWFGGER